MKNLLDSRVNNLDFARLLFAFLVIYSHSYPLSGQAEAEPFYRATHGQLTGGDIAVSAFFFISGFLITASYVHSKSILQYVKKRIARIYPAFIVLTMFDLFVVLPISHGHLTGSSLPRQILSVVWKTLSLASFSTSNAFLLNPFPAVINGSLWTIRFEFACYLGVILLGVCGLINARGRTSKLLVLTLVATMCFAFSRFGLYGIGKFDDPHHSYFEFLLRLAPIYLSGVVFYLYRDRVTLSLSYALLAALVLVIAAFVPRGLMLAMPTAGGYLLLYLAFNPKIHLHHFARKGDFSYGTYLYAFPVQQLIMQWNHTTMTPVKLFAISALITLCLAMLSWHMIERHFLSRSRVLH